jgi:aryl-alcohol dehydrogenase-like predicted oxidoreductase
MKNIDKIALGTVQFGIDYGINSDSGKIHYNEVVKILNYARSIGINFLDTAPAYGSSQQVLGKTGINDFEVVTKTRKFSQKTITSQDTDFLISDFNQSLEVLNTSSVYGLLIHDPSDLLKSGSEELFIKLQALKQEGLVSKIGVSIYNFRELEDIMNNFDIDLVQLPLSIFDKRLVGNGMLNKLYKQGVEIHVRSIFLQGLLLMSKKSRPNKFNRWNTLWNTWDEWLKDNNVSALEACIRYAISLSEVSKVLVGIDSKDQLTKIIDSIDNFPALPDFFFTDDDILLNPSNWNNL